MKKRTYWLACPKCSGKMIMVRDDTTLINFPAWCKHCKEQSIITLEPESRKVESKVI